MKSIFTLLIFLISYLFIYTVASNNVTSSSLLFLAVILIASSFALYSNRYNLLFFIRTLVLAIIGVTPLLATSMGGYYSRRSVVGQYDEVSVLIGLLLLAALLSSQVGFFASKRLKNNIKVSAIYFHTKFALFFTLFLSVLIGIMISYIRGDNIFNIAYATAGNKNSFPVNATQVMANVSYILALHFYYKCKHIYGSNKTIKVLIILTFIFIVVFSQLLKGARLDPLTMMLSTFIMYRIHNNKDIRVNVKLFVILLIIYVLSEMFGYFRTAIFDGIDINQFLATIRLNARYLNEIEIISVSSNLANLSAGLAGTIEAIKVDDLDFYYGSTYVDYLLRSFPAFIYADRPQTLAWLLPNLYGTSAGGGGYTEMAEIYLNFGIFGFLFIPGIISYIIGTSYYRYKHNLYSFNIQSLLFISIISIYIRGLTYQTFSFYRSLTVTIFILFIISVVGFLLKTRGEK